MSPASTTSPRARRSERLGIDIEAVHLGRPELCGGQRQHTRAAAVVDDARTGAEVPIEPRQAQRRARMTAGAERQPRIECHHNRAGLGDLLMVRAYPQTPAEAQRVKVSEPLALPDASSQLVHADEGGVKT